MGYFGHIFPEFGHIIFGEKGVSVTKHIRDLK